MMWACNTDGDYDERTGRFVISNRHVGLRRWMLYDFEHLTSHAFTRFAGAKNAAVNLTMDEAEA